METGLYSFSLMFPHLFPNRQLFAGIPHKKTFVRDAPCTDTEQLTLTVVNRTILTAM